MKELELYPWDKYIPCGASIPPGWNGIVNNLVNQVRQTLDADEYASFQIDQIKEKFGGLRFYISWLADEKEVPEWKKERIDRFIMQAEFAVASLNMQMAIMNLEAELSACRRELQKIGG